MNHGAKSHEVVCCSIENYGWMGGAILFWAPLSEAFAWTEGSSKTTFGSMILGERVILASDCTRGLPSISSGDATLPKVFSQTEQDGWVSTLNDHPRYHTYASVTTCADRVNLDPHSGLATTFA